MPKSTSVCVLTHGHCFDGLASAAIFTAFWRELRGDRRASFHYRSCGYGPKLTGLPPQWLKGTENALLDFRYADHPRLGWYFDHHPTAFANDEQQRRATSAETAKTGKQVFFDASRPSCAGLLFDVARRRFGVELPSLVELATWADTIDGARFTNAEQAYFADAAPLRIADVVERHGDGEFLASVVPLLLRESLESVAASEVIAARAKSIASKKGGYLDQVRRAGCVHEDAVLIDLSAEVVDPAGKFAQYVAFPESRYSVALLRTRDQIKLGLGHNPWSGKPRLHDLGELCRAEGGGGHAVVGGVAFAHDEIDRARATASRMIQTLGAAP